MADKKNGSVYGEDAVFGMKTRDEYNAAMEDFIMKGQKPPPFEKWMKMKKEEAEKVSKDPKTKEQAEEDMKKGFDRARDR